MPEMLADRFLKCGAAWMDLATGATVRLRVTEASADSAFIAWNDQRATLSRLRHPLLNPLIDYGHADARHTFEAYAISPPIAVRPGGGALLQSHAVRFLEANGVCLSTEDAKLTVRQVSATPRAQTLRPFGVVLQPRRAFSAVEDMLSDSAPGGVASFLVSGAPGSGVRTLRAQLARSARLQGYTPVAATVLEAMPWLQSQLRDRHVCVLVDPAARAAESTAARFAASLGIESARRHVLVRFGREMTKRSHTVVLDPMGVTAMISMVFVDSDHGPHPGEIAAAAHAAEGSPGRFLAELRAAPFLDHRPAIAMVHESTIPYTVRDTEESAPARRQTVRRSLVSARLRASRLAARGRHAAAVRLLTRASRVLELRGERLEAARCARDLGWTLRARGRNTAALEQFERARTLAPADAEGIQSTIAVGVSWTDDRRFAEAQAVLRSAVTAAELLKETNLCDRARLALGRCQYWQAAYDEAAVTLASLAHATGDLKIESLALLARIELAKGRLREAISAASEALELESGDARCRAVAARSLALALAAAGDKQGARKAARDGLKWASAAHLPLIGLRLRAALPDRSHLFNGTARTLPLSPLLRTQLTASADTTGTGAPALPQPAVDDLQQLLELAFGAIDDRTAVADICKAIGDRARAATVQVVSSCSERRLLARAGRPWCGDTTIVERTLAACASCSSTGIGEPRESAHPIRYSNETIAVLACRWTAAADPDMNAASGLLRAAALAIAPSVRAMLDRPRAEATEPVWHELIGAQLSALRDSISRAARAPFPVLIEGESGSGKELVARAIHRLGARRERRLCAVNCAAISEELVEAELFGHARGAFTGALTERAGLFEEADGGTLFLDEVAELSQRAQAKLLRVLQDGEVRRVGENFPRRVDARVIAATNRRLEEEVDAGRFRSDLRFRLDVVRIPVPPLRDRQMDIPMLAAHFWEEAARRVESRASLAPDTIAALTRYDWPGNVRQLQNVIASLAVHAPRRGRVPPALLPAHIARCAATAATTFDAAREEFERRFVTAALARAGGHRARAARALGVTRQGLAKMLRRLGIDP